MLLTKEVKINLASSNIKYYEDKGYKIPRYKDKQGRLKVRRGTSIVVKVEDVSIGCSALVDCKCDLCKKDYKVSFNHYATGNHDGKTYCENCYHKALLSGENHPNWNKNKTQEERENGRKISEYTDFVKRVMSRDNFTCQCCNQHSGNLEVHHLDGYDWCTEKRTVDTNGITLCENCHSNFHSYYGYGNNTKEQFEEWMDKTIDLLKYNGEISKSRLIICLETEEIDVVGYFVNKYNIKDTRIYRCCNKQEKTANNKHFLWYETLVNMSENDIEEYLAWSMHNNRKQVICINTLEVFDKMSDALKKYNINSPSLLTRCCQGKNNYAGEHPNTKEKLKWMYLVDYIKFKNNLKAK